jgi:hypothetical protein
MPRKLLVARIRRIAKYQRWVIAALVVNVVLTFLIVTLALGQSDNGSLGQQLARIVGLSATIFMMTSLYMLAKQLSNSVLAAAATALMLIPILSFIVLLIYNQRATKFLREYGIKVGLFGANPRRILVRE